MMNDAKKKGMRLLELWQMKEGEKKRREGDMKDLTFGNGCKEGRGKEEEVDGKI